MKKNIVKKITTLAFTILFFVIFNTPTHTIFAQTSTSSSNSYVLLAPLSGDTTFNPATTNALSTYVNLMIRIFISIAAVLAMIMIVMGGIEYMTSDIVSSKEQGKKRISNALIGLVLALSAYLLLFTINPNLLKTIDVNDESQLPTGLLTLEEAPPTSNDYQPIGTQPTNTDKTCPSGITRITSTGQYDMQICSSIASQLQNLLKKAWSSGIPLAGWGWRSYAKQLALRQNNCPDPLNSPSSACKPATAIPGTSMHEQGLAVDFTCNGATIKVRSGTCYDFLVANASAAGLINLVSGSEAWHWSTTGH